MHLRLALVALVLGFIVGCNCGPADPCAETRCGAGLVCDANLGRCVVDPAFNFGVGGSTGTGGATGAGGSAGTGGSSGTGGGTSAVCSQSCGGATPVCDESRDRCVICTPTEGCGGDTPICFTDANGGLGRCMTCLAGQGCGGDTPLCDVTIPPAGGCYQCDLDSQCTGGLVCDTTERRCVVNDGGFATGGGGGTTVVWADGGVTTRCLAGPPNNSSCGINGTCREGFECWQGRCILRGSRGPVQVTLRWDQAEDLDLYLVEPLTDGGTCEIYYGMPGPVPNTSPIPIPIPPRQCGSKGWLDLDSNPACAIDNVDIENIIYDQSATLTPGTYTVRANYYQSCNSPASVPYEVEVRANGQTRYFCGSFTPSQANGGNQGAGRVITTFDIR